MRLITLCSLIILALSGTAHPQAAKSELVGEVRDQNGALVPNAKVSLTEVATGQSSSKVTPDGLFIMTNLKPGIYNVAVEADGFKQALREGVRLATGERVRLDVTLDPGAGYSCSGCVADRIFRIPCKSCHILNRNFSIQT